MALKNIIGWQIRRLRVEKGMTVHQLASALPKSSPLTSEEISRIELGARKVFDREIQALCQALDVTVEDLYATSLGRSPEDSEAWETLVQLEDIISGIEAQADNLGIDLEEARHWWQKVRRLIDRRKPSLAKPAEGSSPGQVFTPRKKVKKSRI